VLSHRARASHRGRTDQTPHLQILAAALVATSLTHRLRLAALASGDTSRRSAERGGRAAQWTKQVICARTGSAHVQLFATQVCLWLGEPRVSVAWRAAADCRRAQDELRRTGPAPRAAEAIATVAAHRPLSSLGVLLPHRRTTRLIRLRARPPFEPMAHPFSEVTRRGVSNDKLDAPARRDRRRALSLAHRRGDFAVAVQPRS